MTSTFVTGGSGLIGGALVRRLVDDGREVRALARSEGAQRSLARLGARPTAGDVLDRGSLAEAMRGCDTVFHVAGVNEMCPRDPSHLFEVNVRGSVNVCEVASRSGVGRVVYTSSAAVLGETAGTVGSESSPHRGWWLSRYEHSKFVAERAVMDCMRNSENDLVCVNPSSVQGPGRSGGTARILILLLRGKLKFFVDTNLSILDIDDCIEGHLLAESKGASGERYVLNGATLGAVTALEMVSRLAGKELKPRLVPGGVAVAGAGAIELAARLRNKKPPVCREMVRTLLHGHVYDGGKATRELGLRYRPVEETLRKTIEWLTGQGLLGGDSRGA